MENILLQLTFTAALNQLLVTDVIPVAAQRKLCIFLTIYQNLYSVFVVCIFSCISLSNISVCFSLLCSCMHLSTCLSVHHQCVFLSVESLYTALRNIDRADIVTSLEGQAAQPAPGSLEEGACRPSHRDSTLLSPGAINGKAHKHKHNIIILSINLSNNNAELIGQNTLLPWIQCHQS